MSSIRSRAGVLALSSLLAACAGAEPPPPAQPVVEVAPAPPPPPPAPPAMLVVPGAERSGHRVPDPKPRDVPQMRSEGKRHGLARTADGIVIVSEDRGVLGFLESPVPGAEIRWAGFVEEDAVLVVTPGALHRAATPEDAITRRYESLERLDPAAVHFASAGKIVMAAAAGDDGALYESRDGGRHFTIAKRPAKGPIVDIEVRSDGYVVVGFQRAPIVNFAGTKGFYAELYTAKSPGAWVKGPMARAFFGSGLSHHGDAITILSDGKKKGDPDDLVTLGLDAKGNWIPTDYPGEWLPSPWTSSYIQPSAPRERPGIPKAGKQIASDVLGGIMGGGGRERCSGATCLARRFLATSPPRLRAFQDAECAKQHVVTRTETIHVLPAPGLSGAGKDETHTITECDKNAPARRGATLLVRGGDDPLLAKLPVWCAEGRIVGTDHASFVSCSAKHKGRPAILHVSPAGVITEVAPAPDEIWILGAESTSDGTTAIFAKEASWICKAGDAPACVRLPGEGFLAARPQPGGRALVARRGASDRELVLELRGDAAVSTSSVKVTLTENLLDFEVTAEGNVRLWTSASLQWMESAETLARKKGEIPLTPYLVRADGELVIDTAARDALRDEVEALRAKR
jgi:hypothetical protein